MERTKEVPWFVLLVYVFNICCFIVADFIKEKKSLGSTMLVFVYWIRIDSTDIFLKLEGSS